MMFTNTRTALAEFDLGLPERDAAWQGISTMEEFNRCEAADAAAMAKLHLAFYEDTKEYNRLHHCKLLHIGDIRRMCALDVSA